MLYYCFQLRRDKNNCAYSRIKSMCSRMNVHNPPPQSRVPGLMPRSKEYSLHKDLGKLNKLELLDLKVRQLKLLKNKSRLQKLPDKGQKIQDLYDRVEKQLEISHQIDTAADLLSALNIGKCDITSIEWNRKSKMENKSTELLDSDDDEEAAGNPFAILANSNTVHQNKKLTHNVPNVPDSLVTQKDIEEAEEITNSDLHLEIGAINVCNKESMELSDRFLPYRFKTTKTDSESTTSKPDKIRDNTAASYPILKCGVKMLTLRDSIEIENIQRKKMLIILEKQASDRLETRLKLNPTIGLPTSDIPRNVAIRGVEHVFDTDDEESEEDEEQEFDEGDQ